MMYKENIKAILECNFAGFKQEIIDSVCDRILEQRCDDCNIRKIILDKIEEVCFSKEQKWVDFRVSQGSNGQRDFIIGFIKNLSSIQSDAKIGYWINSNKPNEEYVCSECGGGCWYYDYLANVAKSSYCPNCGAKMIGVEEHE